MAEKGNAYSITKKSLEAHLEKVSGQMSDIQRGSTFDPINLFNLVKDIGGDKFMTPKEVQETMDVIRKGLCVFYEVYGLLEIPTDKVNSAITNEEKTLFLNAYSMFVAGSYIQHGLETLVDSKIDLKKEDFKFNFQYPKDTTLRDVLVRYSANVNAGKAKVFEKPIDLARGSIDFFKFLGEAALDKKPLFNPKLVELVKDATFKIEDTFTVNGFESSHEEKLKAKAVEFVPMYPHQVAGNVLAKKEMTRDMDRIALFDMVSGKNPIIEVGGLSWSVLYDGLPGTGKSSLFRMGLTRLKQRCEQVSEYLKSKNLAPINFTQIIVDQGVKDEYYGKTGKNLLEKLEVTKRPDGIYIITTDDIDLLVSGDRNSSSGGADKDILNILMQYADGINTVIRGNVQWWAATNDATSMDPALRQRFIARYSVDGPQEWYDFADILGDKLGKWIKLGIVQLPTGKTYKPYEMRKGQTGYEATEDQPKGKIKVATFEDIGRLCKEKKDQNERFTGRAIHSVSEAIKKRINDYEIPEDWYSKPEVFLAKDYETKANMLRSLCQPVTPEVIAWEIERYAESELRYANDKFESDVTHRTHQIEVELETNKRLKVKYGGEK